MLSKTSYNYRRFGRFSDLPTGNPVDFVVQQHDAQRAGKHRDVRFGTPSTGLYSFATKKEIPAPGDKRVWYQQPVHGYSYKDFEGKIPSGYGKGTVKKERDGKIIITDASNNYIRFLTADKKNPEYFIMLRMKDTAGSGSKRDKQTQGGSWLVVNTTPNKPVDYKKPKYKQVSAAEIDKLFNNDSVLSEKIDGAQALLSVMNDSVRIMSYRTDKSGKPIVHTDRLRFKQPDTVPAEYRNRQFVGELWASKNNKAVPHSTLSALLNSTPENARKRMAVESIKPHMALFGEITNTDKWYDMPVNKRRAIIQDFIKAIGMGNQLHEPEYAYTREEKRNLWNKILDKSNLRTREGVISYPFSGGKPIKVKIRPEMDVYIKDLLTGSGKFKDMNSRFAYSTQPGGPVKGIVGTGFSDEDREMMTNDPSAYIGRKARVNYQDVFNSGALRAPSFISLHEE